MADCRHDKCSRPYPVSLEAAKALGLSTSMAPAMCWTHVRGHGQCRLMVTTLCHCGRRVCPEHAPESRL